MPTIIRTAKFVDCPELRNEGYGLFADMVCFIINDVALIFADQLETDFDYNKHPEMFEITQITIT